MNSSFFVFASRRNRDMLSGPRLGEVVSERRASERWPIRCEIHCKHGDQVFRAESFEISENGMSFVTDAHLPLNTEAELHYRLHLDDPLIIVRVLVRSQAEGRFGVQFLDLKHEHRERILQHRTRVIAAAAKR